MKQIILTLGIVVVIAVLIHYVSGPKKPITEEIETSTSLSDKSEVAKTTTETPSAKIEQEKPLSKTNKTETKSMNQSTVEQKDEKIELITTPSGLQYAILLPGTGEVAVEKDTVSVHYVGTLTDGTVFDQSVGRGPIEFKLGTKQVIAGWDEGIAGMKVGEKKVLVIPPALGYGNNAVGSIPANSTLIFRVELMKVVKK